MTVEAFRELVSKADYLDADAKQQLLENAAWLRASERAALAQQIEQTAGILEKNQRERLKYLEQVEASLEDFTNNVLPAALKTQESAEKQQSGASADQLLESM